jgi:hypothetical protein
LFDVDRGGPRWDGRPVEARDLRQRRQGIQGLPGSAFSGERGGLRDPAIPLDPALELQAGVDPGDLGGVQAAIWSK